MKRRIHAVAGTVAMATVLAFWVSTIVSELALGPAAVAAVKRAILYGLLLLVPAIAATGGSGLALAKGRSGGLLGAKKRRMPFLAANGLLVLAPSAFFLDARASVGQLDATFYAVQLLELTAGALQLALLGLNFLDGLCLAGLLPRRRRAGTAHPKAPMASGTEAQKSRYVPKVSG